MLDRVVCDFSSCFGSADHAQEDHFLVTHDLNLFASDDASDPALDKFSRDCFFLSCSSLRHFAFADLALRFLVDNLGEVLLKNLLHSVASLSATLVLLNQADGRNDFHVQGKGVMHDFFHRFRAFVVSAAVVRVHYFVNNKLLFLHRLRLLLWLLVVGFLFL